MNLDNRLNERLKYAAMKARHREVLRPWYKKWWGAVIIALGSLFLIVLTGSALYVAEQTREILSGQAQAMTEEQRQAYVQTIQGDGTNYTLGSEKPQATIIEFGDFACPYSKESAPVIKKLTEEYRDRLKIVWRDYLRNDDSIDLALAARCAGEQGKFWEMHDALFENQESLTVNDSARPGKLTALAGSLGVEATQFSSCLTGRKYINQIKRDYDDGNKLEIIGTPSWFVNNYPFHGALPEESFRELIGGITNKTK